MHDYHPGGAATIQGGGTCHSPPFILSLKCLKLDLESLNLPAAYFSSFDHIVRKQLDPIWHKVGPSTKALVRDLGVLRRLVSYLLVYDPLQFHSFCQVLVEAATSNTAEPGSGSGKSQWMLTDAANIVFQAAKRRCFVDVPPQEQSNEVEVCNRLG